MKLDGIILGDCLAVMGKMEDCCIDLTVTSPPYDNLRTYNGHSEFDFEGIAKELYRITKDGGVVVWIVADATVNGSETLTSMRQAIYFKDMCGFNIHDTMLYLTNKPPLTHNRYEQSWEYCFVMSKGVPKTFNGLKRKASTPGGLPGRFMQSADDKKYSQAHKQSRTSDRVLRINAWYYHSGHDSDNGNHPAPFPEALAADHILSWSNPGDMVLDCFSGSGTTCKMAKLHNRHFIGIEINPEYVDICNKRLSQEVFDFG